MRVGDFANLSCRRSRNTNDSTQDSRQHSLHSCSQMGDDKINNLSHVIVRGNATGFAQEIQIGSHRLTGDEPVSSGGTDTGPSPYDLLLAALGSCTSMTISLYARLEEVTVLLSHSKIYAADCAECETREGRVDRIEREIKLTGQITAEQRSKLMEIADKCPVHRTLTSEIDIRTKEKAAG